MSRIKITTALLVTSFIAWSCVETTITVRVLPDGHYTVQIHSAGDSSDVFDDDFPHPSGPGWSTVVHREQRDDQTVWVMQTDGYRQGHTIFTTDTTPVPLRHPLEVIRTSGWFSTTYQVRQRFVGRGVFKKYPALAINLTSGPNDSTEWIAEAFYYITTQALKDLQRDSSTALSPLLHDRIENHLRGIFYRLEEKQLFEELKDKQGFLRRILQPFREQLPPNFPEHLSTATEVYQQELHRTQALQDDQFNFHLFMPGVVTYTNADTIIGDTLKWSFGLEDYLNDDLLLEAESVVYSRKHLQLAILIGAGMLIFALGLGMLRRRKAR